METILGILQVVIAGIAGVVVAWYWNERNDKLAEYRYLDATYWKLLEAYAQRPEFGDRTLTDTYETSFPGKDALSYHFFAMRVHTVMESIFDSYYSDCPKWAQVLGCRSGSNIPKVWIHIFDYHTKLHAKWLERNQAANEAKYVARVLHDDRC